MMRRPFMCRKIYTTAPMGHSTTAATAHARIPTVGPTTLHRHGLLLVPHCTHNIFLQRKFDIVKFSQSIGRVRRLEKK
ncbi:hypothetical protein MA16_Dca022802 [Dendrobium catenatum]|uniref:Uncharacterized protein n=1 Tax=Dendrobium catenatum TaxID=906689 RepID=A0A2I0W7R5_9ASPA|nr:hypothetical protein MA16_Dca022802 [Dendrobium catenatum]